MDPRPNEGIRRHIMRNGVKGTWGWKLFLRFYGVVRALGVTLTELLGLWRITETDGKSSECLSFLWKCSIGYGRVHGVHGSALCQKAVWKG